MKQVMEIIDLLDDPQVDVEHIKTFLQKRGIHEIKVVTLEDKGGKTDMLKVIIPGKHGKIAGGNAPTLGIVGRLGGIGVRPEYLGLVSDADGAIVALSSALKIGEMKGRGDVLEGDVIITTHISPSSPILPHKPVPFVTPPIDIVKISRYEVDPAMDAILSVDATKGNKVIKIHGFAITPTVKKGWILKVSEDLINIYERVVGDVVTVVPITMQDITPFESGVYHINSIMLPWLATDAPVVGVATTARVPVPGCGTGSNYIYALESATRFCVEVAKDYTSDNCRFYDEEEYNRLVKLYGDMAQVFRRHQNIVK